MPERLVLCGGLSGAGVTPTALHLNAWAKKGAPERVNLSISRLSRALAADIPDRLIDLLEIAVYVYSADQFTPRGGPTLRGMGRDWRRDFTFHIPVRDLEFWRDKNIEQALADTLGFLSDDAYGFRFFPAPNAPPIQAYLDFDADGPPRGFEADRIVLFSGGLDSLAGAASALLRNDERLVLVSHQASTMVQSRQNELTESLRKRLPSGRVVHVGMTGTKGRSEAGEFTQRSRSFLFAALGFVVAYMFRRKEVTFYENGVVSLNLPLASHIVGARATRTTHPRVLADFSRLLALVAERPSAVLNRYFWLTKSEVVRELAESGAADLIARSFSCSRVRLGTKTGQQCGTCTQCLDRRFAVLAARLNDFDPADGYRVDLLTGAREPGADLVLAESYVRVALDRENMSESAFLIRNGEVFRALPYLGDDLDESARGIVDLHRRHGRSVREVIEAGLAEHSTVEALRRLPAGCLLSLIQSPYGGRTPRDPIEMEDPAPVQAGQLQGPFPVERPIRFAIDRRREVVAINDVIELEGAPYRLIAALDEMFVADLAAGLPQGDFRFVKARSLASRLSTTDENLRQLVLRTRRRLTDQFLRRCDRIVQANDIVEHESWLGYRLNPWLSRAAAADSNIADPEKRGGVTSSSRMSRLSSRKD